MEPARPYKIDMIRLINVFFEGDGGWVIDQ